MKTKHLVCSALGLGLAGGALWAASLGITLTNRWNQRIPLLWVDGPLGSTNQLHWTPVLRETNAWHLLAEIVLTNHPTPYVDETAASATNRYYRAVGGGVIPTNPPTGAPVYFNLFYHQEGVGTLCTNPPFPKFQEWRTGFLEEVAELDLRGIVSDQYLSDYMVDVIRYHSPMIPDPLFAVFANSPMTRLGYHFHPASGDVTIRSDQIRNLEFWEAVATYPIWERAYYDWHPCVPPSTNCVFCGRLDRDNPTGGGIAVMEAAFGKPCVVDSGCGAPEALVYKANYPNLVTEAGGAAVHTLLCSPLLPHSWRANWDLSPDPYRYVYKMMGLYRLRATSLAWIEPSQPLLAKEQMLALLPRDRPHIVMVHGYNRAMSADLELVQRFITNNPGCRFISASELPALVDPSRNDRTYSMIDLEEGARYLLRNWHGRPPGFIVTERRYLPLTALFRALQTVLRDRYAHPQAPWPESVTVPEFIPPPLGDQEALPSMDECHTYLPVSVTNLAQIIQSLSTSEIPWVADVWVRGDGWSAQVKINAAELLNGMCTLFLKHRANELFSEICLRKGHVIPLSNITHESDCSRCCGTGETPPAGDCLPCQPKAAYADCRRDWYNQLQLWTLEPVDLRTLQIPQAR
ncbi:MAG TPA: hypothetical protein PKM73_09790 [Verrucomicrobiota bacterium]|nr:hypothetical protein [Verrucomicrobiota bacterium]